MSSSENHNLGRFLLLDIGFPMTQSTVDVIKASLANVLSLACSLTGNARIPVFGLGMLGSQLKIIQHLDFLFGNYTVIADHLESSGKYINVGVKVTLKDYKIILESSIQKIFQEFEAISSEWKMKNQTKKKLDPQKYWPAQFQVTLITKKAASPILYILKENPQLRLQRRLKVEIIEVLCNPDSGTSSSGKYGNHIEYSTVSESAQDMDAVFKKWIMNSGRNGEQLRLILGGSPQWHIKCDINDCIVNPTYLPISQSFSLPADFPRVISRKIESEPRNERSVAEFEIISKIGVSDLGPSYLFGLPQLIQATRSSSLKWEESELNKKLFHALCFELHRCDIGLIIKHKRQPFDGEINYFHLITSDGKKLLLRSVVPQELQLPDVTEPPTTFLKDDVREEFGIVRSCINAIHKIEDVKQQFTAGIYRFLMDHIRNERKRVSKHCTGFELLQNLNLENTKLNRTKDSEDFETCASQNITPGEYTPKFFQDKVDDKNANRHKKNQKNSNKISKRKRTEEKTLHPALLSPKTIAKYRKKNYNSFPLPELAEPGIV